MSNIHTLNFIEKLKQSQLLPSNFANSSNIIFGEDEITITLDKKADFDDAMERQDAWDILEKKIGKTVVLRWIGYSKNINGKEKMIDGSKINK